LKAFPHCSIFAVIVAVRNRGARQEELERKVRALTPILRYGLSVELTKPESPTHPNAN